MQILAQEFWGGIVPPGNVPDVGILHVKYYEGYLPPNIEGTLT